MFDIIVSVIIYGVFIFVIGYGVYTLVKKIKNKRKRNEEVDD